MSHLDFLVSMDWQEESSRVVRRLVQTQSHLPEAWVFAARFEVERKVIKSQTFVYTNAYTCVYAIA